MVYEEDIESWIAADPGRVFEGEARLIGRQVHTGSGRLDLLVFQPGIDPGRGMHSQPIEGRVVIVEVKRATVRTSAVAQLSRYLNDLSGDVTRELFSWAEHRPVGELSIRRGAFGAPDPPGVEGLLVGQAITDEAAEIVRAHPTIDYTAVDTSEGFRSDPAALNYVDTFARPSFSEARRSTEILYRTKEEWRNDG